ncbi:hypothetical protein ES703_119119 [subsurface metagenome]
MEPASGVLLFQGDGIVEKRECAMTELEGLILYWRDRLPEPPPITSQDWKETIRATIKYLEELQKIKGGAQ